MAEPSSSSSDHGDRGIGLIKKPAAERTSGLRKLFGSPLARGAMICVAVLVVLGSLYLIIKGAAVNSADNNDANITPIQQPDVQAQPVQFELAIGTFTETVVWTISEAANLDDLLLKSDGSDKATALKALKQKQKTLEAILTMSCVSGPDSWYTLSLLELKFYKFHHAQDQGLEKITVQESALVKAQPWRFKEPDTAKDQLSFDLSVNGKTKTIVWQGPTYKSLHNVMLHEGGEGKDTYKSLYNKRSRLLPIKARVTTTTCLHRRNWAKKCSDWKPTRIRECLSKETVTSLKKYWFAKALRKHVIKVEML